MPFTAEEFVRVFARYNEAVWLAQLLLIGAGPRITFVIPVIWALIGTVAAFRFNVPQDYGLLVAAALALTILRASDKKATVGPVAPMTASA